MVAPFPLAKLAILAVKQMSKPLANYIKRRAKAHRVFRDYICIPTAQRTYIKPAMTNQNRTVDESYACRSDNHNGLLT